MNELEILAPCGDYNSVICSINAGADAVYLGGPMFSARAYATNLTIDEIVSSIHYAHLHSKKVYLTLNTLLKNSEILPAIEMIKPLYEAGLDAIIIQDTGLLNIVKTLFPSLDIHISTQMSVMSHLGVRFFKDYKVTRVVPARELSADEIGKLKAEGLEIECFVHGAMCYSYSGKCLFSSIAGGRSGNRGRCAGPCRKQYDVIDENGRTLKSNCYPISMKDMCSIEDVGLLIDAKVDSYKIEGRMKAKEYSAGVSAIYKKYSLDYIAKKQSKVSNNDKRILSNLYVRSELQSGYLKKHNGRDMISLSSPAYNPVNENTLKDIRNMYDSVQRVLVEITVNAYKDTLLSGSITYKDKYVYVETTLIEAAKSNPTTEESIIKQMCKLGNTFYECRNCIVNTDNQSFIPTSILNELRRQLVMELEKELFVSRQDVKDFGLLKNLIINTSDCKFENDDDSNNKLRTIIGVSTHEQLSECLQHDEYDEYIIDLFSDAWPITNSISKDFYLRIPPIVRDNRIGIIEKKIESIISAYKVKGIYVNSIDGLMVAGKYFDKNNIYGDTGLYVFNDYAVSFYREHVNEYTVSLELNEKDIRSFSNKENRQLLIYGYIPLMYSANCLVNTVSGCNTKKDGLYLRDDKKREFYSKCNHELCYNTIYNNVPLCLFSEDINRFNKFLAYRIDFTYENRNQVRDVLNNYRLNKKIGENINKRNNLYTLGHYKRGVE